ncbi:virion protein [Glossina pallidipes salivary gland hypertrophy virus]|uniref:Virion protein n=1 Tax=Glossina hytrovirus (isolate Glossina pallidipes/Ethiopia/Seibersdorf/-) TaxID=379529 RepID=A0A125QZQ6_GHVS|nr:virion protein [Glossina pallidipes salivary gland hypertrophy virus]
MLFIIIAIDAACVFDLFLYHFVKYLRKHNIESVVLYNRNLLTPEIGSLIRNVAITHAKSFCPSDNFFRTNNEVANENKVTIKKYEKQCTYFNVLFNVYTNQFDSIYCNPRPETERKSHMAILIDELIARRIDFEFKTVFPATIEQIKITLQVMNHLINLLPTKLSELHELKKYINILEMIELSVKKRSFTPTEITNVNITNYLNFNKNKESLYLVGEWSNLFNCLLYAKTFLSNLNFSMLFNFNGDVIERSPNEYYLCVIPVSAMSKW